MIESRYAVYGCLGALALGLWWWTSQEPVKKPTPTAAKTSNVLPISSDFIDADYTAHFDKPKSKMRNLFMPGIKSESAAAAAQAEEIVKIPANFAKGDPNWAYTGMANINGKRMALLENSSSHQSGFVKEGEPWLTSTVTRITMESIALIDRDGIEQVVMRYNANLPPKPKPAEDTGFRPLEIGPALKGVIGSKLELHPAPETQPKKGAN